MVVTTPVRIRSDLSRISRWGVPGIPSKRSGDAAAHRRSAFSFFSYGLVRPPSRYCAERMLGGRPRGPVGPWGGWSPVFSILPVGTATVAIGPNAPPPSLSKAGFWGCTNHGHNRGDVVPLFFVWTRWAHVALLHRIPPGGQSYHGGWSPGLRPTQTRAPAARGEGCPVQSASPGAEYRGHLENQFCSRTPQHLPLSWWPRVYRTVFVDRLSDAENRDSG